MQLTHPQYDTALYVCLNMRARDCEEIYGLRWEDNPYAIMNEVMAQRSFAWVAWHDGKPAAVFGGAPTHPGVWQMFAFGTDDFPQVARPMTRFLKGTVVPKLFGEMNAHRLSADSHEKHTEAHRWLSWFGATRESIKYGFGRDGSNYHHFVLNRTLTLDKPDKCC